MLLTSLWQPYPASRTRPDSTYFASYTAHAPRLINARPESCFSMEARERGEPGRLRNRFYDRAALRFSARLRWYALVSLSKKNKEREIKKGSGNITYKSGIFGCTGATHRVMPRRIALHRIVSASLAATATTPRAVLCVYRRETDINTSSSSSQSRRLQNRGTARLRKRYFPFESR